MLHYIITNRLILSDANGEYIKSDGGETPSEILRFGTFDSVLYAADKNDRAAVNIFPDLKPESQLINQVPQGNIPYHSGMPGMDTTQLIGSPKFFTELFNKMQATDGDLLFFIHGFHTDLPGALQSICDLEAKYINDSSPIKHIVVFTWPARDKILRYRDDAKDAELSGYTLARCYLMMIDFFRAVFAGGTNKDRVKPCGNNIHLLAHSMGNRVLESMMIELLSLQGDNVTAAFKEVILAASDVDWQVFEDPRAFNKLTNICQRVTVYYNTRDVALFISETTKNAYNRLGKFGFRTYNGGIPAHIYSVDCSKVKDQPGLENSFIQHWYYKASPEVVEDITLVLKGIQIESLTVTRTAIPSIPIQFRLV